MAINLVFPEGTTLRNNQMITFRKPDESLRNIIINNEIYTGAVNTSDSSIGSFTTGSILIAVIDTENKVIYFQSSKPLTATTSRNGLMTSAQVTDLNTAKTHMNSTSNPHNVTASQVGALPLSGGTMNGSIDMGGQQITNIPTPSANTDAVNKGYLESLIAALGYEDVGIYISETEPSEAVDGDIWFDLSSEPIIDGDGVSY